MPSLRGWQAKVIWLFNACGYLPPYPSAPTIPPPSSSEKSHFSLKTAGKRCSLKKHSIGFGICAVVLTSDYPKIYVGVSLSFRTLGIHHSVQKKISCFAAIVPLLHFSITDGCYSVTICKNQNYLSSVFPYRKKSRKASFGICNLFPNRMVGNFIFL